LWTQDPSLVGIGGGVVGQSFSSTSPNMLGPNPSEAAAALLFAVFVAPALVVLIVRGIRREKRTDWLAVGALTALLILLAYLMIPGWDPVARLLLLDRIPVSRARIGFVALMPVFFALIVREIDRLPARRTWILGAVSGLLAAIGSGAVVIRLAIDDPQVLADAALWPVVAVALVGACVLVFVRNRAPLAAVLLLVASLVIGAAVNPVYRGVLDLNETAAGQAISAVDEAEPGDWVGVGGPAVMALVMQTGVDGYDGVQTYPSAEMWDEIDPAGSYEDAWNRLAHVRWEFGTGDPVVTNPARDIALVTFDACADFAQQHVEYVVTDTAPADAACLDEVDAVDEGELAITIYRVVKD